MVDCPPHNTIHEITHYPYYYDPLYYPEYFPEIFATLSSVRQWIESSLYFHISRPTCCPCSGYHRLEIKISVQWRDPHYLICSYIGGKLKQCVLSLETGLQSKRYTHCQIISRLCTVTQLVPLAASHTDKIYNVISQKIPAWLFHSDELFRLHLSQLPFAVLYFVVKSCCASGSPQKSSRNKTSLVSNIIDHFISERNVFVSAIRNGTIIFSQDNLCDFVKHTEKLYGTSVAALLRESPFLLS